MIRRCTISDIEKLQKFYNENWGSKHPLINIRNFFDFYFLDGNDINFIVYLDENNEIVSSCGYTLSNKTENPSIWTTLWLTKKSSIQNAGLQIVDYIVENLGFNIVSTNNARKNTLALYKFLGYKTSKLNHYYRLFEKSQYHIAIIDNFVSLPYEKTSYILKPFSTIECLKKEFNPSDYYHNKPYKDIDYIEKRLYNFPFIKPLIYGIFNENNKCVAIIAMRYIDVNNARVLRIIDVIGDYTSIANIGHDLNQLGTDCEYIEFYSYGVDDEILRKAGFVKRDEDDKNIIPAYLEPYNPINTDYYFFSTDIDNFTMFMGDGDQDRLNINIL